VEQSQLLYPLLQQRDAEVVLCLNVSGILRYRSPQRLDGRANLSFPAQIDSLSGQFLAVSN